MESWALEGDKNEIVIAPDFKVAATSALNGCTERITSAFFNSPAICPASQIVAPALL